MKRTPYLAAISLALAVSGVVLALLGHPFIGAGLASAGLIACFPVILFPTGALFAVPFLNAAMAGFTYEWQQPTYGLLGLVPLISFTGMYMRLLNYTKMNRTSYRWAESAVALVAAGVYLGANLALYGQWYHWAFPAVPLALGFNHAGYLIFDYGKLLNVVSKGYGIKVGDTAPDFELLNEEKIATRLSDFRGKRHILLIFYRGDWCPYCNIMLRTYAKESTRFQQKNILLLAVGPDDPETNRLLVERMKLDFHILADEDMATVSRYGIQVKGHNPGNRVKYNDNSPLPASFLIDKAGVLRFTSHPQRVGEYLNPALIFPVVDQLS